MSGHERRNFEKPRSSSLRSRLNEDQKLELATLERFGWELKFIRQPPFQQPIPVMYDPETRKYAILKEDGSLDEKLPFKVRD